MLKLPLRIPEYQRPYEWSTHDIVDLLNDIENAISDAEKFGSQFRYRLVTIILHKIDNGKGFDIVDGQQCVVSLTLLFVCLMPDFEFTILDSSFSSSESQSHIQNNFTFVKECLSLKHDYAKEEFRKAFNDVWK